MSAVAPRSSPLALTVLALLHYKPLHPYGVQRLIQQWGKDQVINVGQRASLYRTMDRLRVEGLIAVRETSRDQAYPERTVYEITDAGREAARRWMTEILSAPKQEFPEFPVALSHVLLMTSDELVEALSQRLDSLDHTMRSLDASLTAETARGLPRVAMLESEYVRAVTAAETTWVRSVIDDIRSGRLPWAVEALAAFAED
jgi:DNA-binding PadR family transcriptional regulator